MNGYIILPPEWIPADGPMIFLAGPIQASPDWQKQAINIIHKLKPSIHIASPRKEYIDDTFVYNAQVDWETLYLRRAAKDGVIMFWLAKEEKHICDRAYAQTSRFELGEWKVMHERDGTKLVIGIEEGFGNAKYIRRRFSQDCKDVSICSSLEETCSKAVELILTSG